MTVTIDEAAAICQAIPEVDRAALIGGDRCKSVENGIVEIEPPASMESK